MEHVLRPLEPPFPDEIERVLEHYPKAHDGYILSLFRVFANSMRFLTRAGPANLLDKASPLSLREREIVILRITSQRDCEYEWGIHAQIFAKAARLSSEQITATRLGTSDEACWTASEKLLLRCVDDLCEHAMIRDETLPEFQANWDLEEQLEILALCGHYHLVSLVAKTARLEVEPNSMRFPR